MSSDLIILKLEFQVLKNVTTNKQSYLFQVVYAVVDVYGVAQAVSIARTSGLFLAVIFLLLCFCFVMA